MGVGEDFPVDDRPQPEQPARGEERSERCCGEDWHRQRQARREAWRRFRHQMHEEFHARRRAFRDHMRHQDDVEILGPETLRHRQLAHLVIAGLAVLGLAALINHHSRN